MLVRPGRRVGRGGLLRTAATTAVVAGTATAVSGGMRKHQMNKMEQEYEAEQYEQAQQLAQLQAQQAAAAPPPAPAAPAEDDVVGKLNELAQLKAQGILSDEEFAAAKAKLLG